MNRSAFFAAILIVAVAFGSGLANASDIVVSNPGLPEEPKRVDNANGVVPADVTLYNDARYPDQQYWDVLTDFYRGRSEIESVHEAFEDFSKEPVRVAVLDGGFYDSPDIEWQGGINLSEIDDDKGIELGDDFRQYDPETCDNTHGQAVTSIIGATADNNTLHAGIAEVELYGVRVLGCNNSGLMSDVTEGINWAARHSSQVDQGYPAIDEPVDVINISISGGREDCPVQVQDAIDYANSLGITIVVAAGNSSKDAGGVSPANCDGVITAAAVNEGGDQAYFSNYGSAIDIAAQGKGVVGEDGMDSNGSYVSAEWAGTSFSSPIVAGIIAYTRSLTGNEDPQVDRDLVNASATAFSNTSETLGPGVLNAPLMVENAFGPLIEGGVTAEQVLADPSRCNNALWTDNSPISFPVCELYELSYEGTVSIPDGYEMMVFKGDSDNPLAMEQDNLVKASKEATFAFQLSEPSSKNYGIQLCKPGVSDCQGPIEPIDVRTTIRCSEAAAVAHTTEKTGL
ncbi:S8 family serine peptidase [Salicola sp. Rm-C-2C1-2]|uniref:S8 family peptidase n=1 Tax=Salicola sp. Rm-C-2C1-2 TaxID=3141321 RepID=UPI0032E3FCEB